MKTTILLLTIVFSTLAATAQKAKSLPDSTKKIDIVETACGMCQFGLKGKDCALAVMIDGKAYYADGADIDAYGDAHAKDGFCNAVRKAEVQGTLVDGRYKLTYFKLLPGVVSKKPDISQPGHQE